jgi:hypothetical protein
MSVVLGSEDHSYPELNLPRIGSKSVNLSRAADCCAVRVEDLVVIQWRLKVGAIEYIEELGA